VGHALDDPRHEGWIEPLEARVQVDQGRDQTCRVGGSGIGCAGLDQLARSPPLCRPFDRVHDGQLLVVVEGGNGLRLRPGRGLSRLHATEQAALGVLSLGQQHTFFIGPTQTTAQGAQNGTQKILAAFDTRSTQRCTERETRAPRAIAPDRDALPK
jgi:hypothetical protein